MAERSGDNVWLEIQTKCRELQRTGEPLRTLDRGTPNRITAVSDRAIRRLSEDSRTDDGSEITKGDVLRIWNELIETGESRYSSGYRMAWALVDLIDGVEYRSDPFRLELVDRSRALRPFGAAVREDHLALTVYVSQAGQVNLRVGLDGGTWGFKENRPDYARVRSNDLILLGFGHSPGGPRVAPSIWPQGRLERLVVGRVTEPFFEDASPFWPDEGPSTSYPYRVHFEIVRELNNVALDEDHFEQGIAEALRLSGVNKGWGYLVPISEDVAAELTGEASPSPLPPEESPLPTGRVWWVNQGKTYKQERDGGYVWAPKQAKDGQLPAHWLSVSHLEPGDVVVHYSQGAVQALSTVTASVETRDRPAELDPAGANWGNEGFFVATRYYPLDTPINLSELTERPASTGPFDKDRGIKQGYMYSLDEPFTGYLRETFRDRWPKDSPWGGEPRRFWMFQGNPQQWDIDAALAENRVGDEETWTVTRHRGEMRPGDGVVIWASGHDGGIRALGELTGAPVLGPRPDWRPAPSSGAKEEWRVSFRYTEILQQGILRAEVIAHPVLSGLQVLRMPQGTNYAMTPEEWSAVQELVSDQPTSVMPPAQPFGVELVQQLVDKSGLLLDPQVVPTIVAALESGKHVILTGPPGTAKTTLAQLVAQAAVAAQRCEGSRLTTATSDWTTFETVGGLHPSSDGTLTFELGQFLAAIEANEWLVIDELNRSNFDRAFGQLFTVLAGQSVELPYRWEKTDKLIELRMEGRPVAPSAQPKRAVVVPKSWRMIATMNVFDKSLLFEMSFALMRRFAFIEVGAPSAEAYVALVRREAGGDDGLADQLESVISPLLELRRLKELGPSLFIDMAAFCRERLAIAPAPSPPAMRFQLFYSYLLPQFEGITSLDGQRLYKKLKAIVGKANHARLRQTLKDVLGIQLSTEFNTDEDDGDEDATEGDELDLELSPGESDET